MSEEIKTAQQILDEARAAFQGTLYTSASALFDQAALLLPGCLEAPMYAVISRFMAGQRMGHELVPVWENLRPLLERALAAAQSPAEAFAIAEQAKQGLAICTAGVYRSCNDRQKAEYAELNKEVKLENKEFIFDEIRRILLEADEEYKVCLKVMYEFSEIASALPHQDQAPESFFLAVLSYVQAAVDLQNESNQEKLFPQLNLAAFACRLKLGEDMNEAKAARNELMKTVMVGQAALDRWEEFAPYAEAAGVTYKVIDKKVKRAQFLEKLKFWKTLKKNMQK